MALPAINIDTLEIARELEGAGVPQQQAEAQTRIYVKIINMVIEERLPTKTDLKDTEQYLASRMDENDLKLDKKIDEVDKRLSHQIFELKHEMHDLYQKMLIRLGGLMISGVVVLAALIKL